MNIEMCHECNEETGNGGVWDGSLIYEGNPYCENCYVPTIVKICEDSLYKITRLQAERDAMREQLDAIDKYLDIGTSDTSIHQNSVMHREVKALLGPY